MLTPTAESVTGTLEAISFYQGASYLYEHGLYRALSDEEFAHFTRLGEETANLRGGLAASP